MIHRTSQFVGERKFVAELLEERITEKGAVVPLQHQRVTEGRAHALFANSEESRLSVSKEKKTLMSAVM